ncbi:MAG: ABC transporter permease [Kiloniellales bacterium]|nr:ABC transporter permease [Kiloniellales bacterium]
MGETFLLILLLIDATVRVATPLLLAAFAGMVAERSGVIDIGLEGKMLAGAFAAAAVAAVANSAWLGLGAAIIVSMSFALLHAYACVTHNGNQVVSGMAINILVAGLGPTLAVAWFGLNGITPALEGAGRFIGLNLPMREWLAPIPLIGPVYSEVISGHNILVYLTLLLLPLVAVLIYRTRFGLRLRAVGENPHAVDTAGISVAALRYRAMLLCGFLCGIAGAYLSTAHAAGFVRDMTAGKGYLALAAMIFGKWKPVPTVLACLLFAFADALQIRLQGVVLPGIGEIPVQVIQALPYALTVILLAGFVGRAVAPKASGIPYVKDK